MSDAAIRDATAGDARELTRLLVEMKQHHLVFAPGDPRFEIPEGKLATVAAEAIGDPAMTVLVADAGDRLTGFVTFRFVAKSWGRSCEVDLLSIDETERGRGLGTRMMAAVDDRARAAGAVGVRLAVTLGNDDALRFYKRLGYYESSIRLAKDLEE